MDYINERRSRLTVLDLLKCMSLLACSSLGATLILVTILACLFMDSLAMGQCQDRTIPGLVTIDLPPGYKTGLGNPIRSVTCHDSMKEPLAKAFTCLRDNGRLNLITTIDGCYCYRNIRGTDRLSNHAHGRAIDINAATTTPPEVAECFKQAGFIWGGDWKFRPDPMHFELPSGE